MPIEGDSLQGPQQQQQALKPSPLRQAAPGVPTPAPSPGPSASLQNPADAYKSNRAKDDYLWAVAARISQYKYAARDQREQGALIIRLVISRDGRLVDSSITKSSGLPSLDKGALEAARAASPYSPLPSALPGDAIAFILPLNFAFRQQ